MRTIRIGTRDSQLAVWQATTVRDLLAKAGVPAKLVYMKSEGDIDTVTPLYALGVTGVFTKTLDAALLNDRIDIAVHSMKDVPTQLAQGLRQAAVLKRASHKDILVFKDTMVTEVLGFANGQWSMVNSKSGSSFTIHHSPFTIATGSVRRRAQWLNRFPDHQFENLRGNVNTRLRKLAESNWHGAIFAAAGLERIGLRPEQSVDLDWMLPAPAQGAIMIACRKDDAYAYESCQRFNHEPTALATKIERDFLSALMGGCSTPISGLATVGRKYVQFNGNIVSPDGKDKAEMGYRMEIAEAQELGYRAAEAILANGGKEIVEKLRNKGLSDEEA